MNPRYRLRVCLLAIVIIACMIAVSMAPTTVPGRIEKIQRVGQNDPASMTRPIAKEPSNYILRSNARDQAPDYVPGELIVKFKDTIAVEWKYGSAVSGISSVDELNKQHCVKGVEKLPSGSYKLTISADADVRYVASVYKKNPNVEFAEPNAIFHYCAIPNDPLYPSQFAHELTQASLAWDLTTGSSNVIVALIDSGVDWDHPDLASNIWINTHEIPGNGIDDDGNHYTDDVRGWDFINGDNNPMDDMGHGTHCAGIIAGKGNNNIGVAGVTWNCKIMSLKAGDEYGGLPNTAIDAALRYAADNGANIVSMSFGGTDNSSLVYSAIQYAYSKGLLLVAAAGNEASAIPSYPGYYREVIAVTATDAADRPAIFTSFGDWVDVSAPGVGIISTMWNDTYAPESGTSMACPYTAGVCGLIWSRFPTLTRNQVRSQLQNTTDDLGNPGFDIYYGWGRVDARWAVDHLSPTKDLRLWGMNSSRVLEPSTTATVTASVFNFGQTAESLVKVNFYVNGALKGSSTIASIPAMKSAAAVFSWTPTSEGLYDLKTQVVLKKADPYPSNDATTYKVLVRTQHMISIPSDFKWPQQGIDYGGPGYTVRVAPGLYLGEVFLGRGVNLVGENRDTTILDGISIEGGASVVYMIEDNATISGFTIRNGYSGVLLVSNNDKVTGNTFENDVVGIAYEYSSLPKDTTVSDNLLLNCEFGIDSRGDRCSITGNTFRLNASCPQIMDYAMDIWMDRSYYSTISNNTMLHSDVPGLALYGIGLEPYGNARKSFVHNCLIENNTVTNVTSGILDIWGLDNTIKDNRISGTNYSIMTEMTTRSLIKRNTIVGGVHGIYATAYKDRPGNAAVDNVITGCSEDGIYDYWSNLMVVGNTIEDSAVEINLTGGPTTIHHNNLLNNAKQVVTNPFPTIPNYWNDTAGEGNFWSDYPGTDTDGDGVGETSLPWQGVDSYPLMHPWGSIENINTALKYATIQKAIDASETVAGNTIYVKAGSYSEHAGITKALIIKGDPVATIIDSGGATAMDIIAGTTTITGFTLRNYTIGITIRTNANNNNVNNNTMTGGTEGIYVLSSTGNLVCDNTIAQTTDGGVTVLQSGQPGNSVFKRNSISSCNRGINLVRSVGNTFAENQIVSNTVGVYVLAGSSNNKFYHNNLVSNADSVDSTTTGVNVWDDGYPSGGNYWSDYAGRDVNHDGIGDTPYVVDTHSQDNYPLVGPWDSRVHDVAATNVVAAPKTVVSGNPVTVTVTVANQGNFSETFAVTAYATSVTIGTQLVTSLAPNSQTVLTFIWNTTGVAAGSYVVNAFAAIVPGETDISDNSKMGDTVTVTPAPVKMHVQSITFATSWSGKTQKLLITVKILDSSGRTVPSATVSGTLTLPGGSTKMYSGATISDGTVTFEYSIRNSALPKGTYTFTVTNVTHATYVYCPGDNVVTSNSYTVA